MSVPVLDDAHDEGSETLVLTLSNVSGGNAYLADATAQGTISNADPLQDGLAGAVRPRGGGGRGRGGDGAAGDAARRGRST